MAKQYSKYTDEELEEAIIEARETALYWQDLYIQALADGLRGPNYNNRNRFDKAKRTKWKKFYRLRDESASGCCTRLGAPASAKACNPILAATRYRVPEVQNEGSMAIINIDYLRKQLLLLAKTEKEQRNQPSSCGLIW